MTAAEFAAALNRPKSTVLLWLRKGLIPDVKIMKLGSERLYLVPQSAVETFVQPKRGRPKRKESSKARNKK